MYKIFLLIFLNITTLINCAGIKADEPDKGGVAIAFENNFRKRDGIIYYQGIDGMARCIVKPGKTAIMNAMPGQICINAILYTGKKMNGSKQSISTFLRDINIIEGNSYEVITERVLLKKQEYKLSTRIYEYTKRK
jgi:hypothetical protein